MAENIEIKRFCADFRPLRRMLKQLGAKHIATKRQTDTYFNLPAEQEHRFKRLKLREEMGTAHLIGYADNYRGGLRDVDYDLVKVPRAAGQLLEGALGVSAVVKKRRELWMLGSTRFHFDTIEGIGKVFEVEVPSEGATRPDDAAPYLRLFEPYLGERIDGSNEDLLRG